MIFSKELSVRQRKFLGCLAGIFFLCKTKLVERLLSCVAYYTQLTFQTLTFQTLTLSNYENIQINNYFKEHECWKNFVFLYNVLLNSIFQNRICHHDKT